MVLWRCISCGHKWKGKSPQDRKSPPRCPKCRSPVLQWKKFRDKYWKWYRKEDRKKWEEIRQIVIKRANEKCEICRIKAKKFHIHHLDYQDYFNPKNLICLCPRCHLIIHGRTLSYEIGKMLEFLGISSFILSIIEIKIHNLMFFFIFLLIGLILVFFSYKLTKETREKRKIAKDYLKSIQ